MDQKALLIETGLALLQLSPLFHPRWPPSLLLGYCWRPYQAARRRAWPFGFGWPVFAPLWLSLVVKDRFIKRAH
jgi:hypothetical protein